MLQVKSTWPFPMSPYPLSPPPLAAVNPPEGALRKRRLTDETRHHEEDPELRDKLTSPSASNRLGALRTISYLIDATVSDHLDAEAFEHVASMTWNSNGELKRLRLSSDCAALLLAQ